MALEANVPTNPYRDPTGSLEGSRDTADGIVVSTEPDICLTPCGSSMVPVGYNIWAKQADDARTTPTVKLTSLRSHNMGSFITTCHGDEAGTGGGVKSGTHNGICEPKGHSANVYSEGKQMIRHTDEWWMNNRNTVGKLNYVKDAGDYARWREKAAGKVQLAFLDTGARSDASGVSGSVQELTQADVLEQTRAAQAQLAEGAAQLVYSNELQALAAREAEIGAAGAELGPEEWVGAGALAGGTEAYALYERRQAQKKIAKATATLAKLMTIARVTGKKNRRPCPCIVGTYKAIKETCAAAECNGEAHHIVPDYTLRYGTRPEGMLVDPARNKRIAGMPSFNGGAAICLEGGKGDDGSEHWEAHGADVVIRALGENGSPRGTAPLGKVMNAAVTQTKQVKGADPVCQEKIDAEVAKDFAGVNRNALARTTESLPQGAALSALSGRTANPN